MRSEVWSETQNNSSGPIRLAGFRVDMADRKVEYRAHYGATSDVLDLARELSLFGSQAPALRSVALVLDQQPTRANDGVSWAGYEHLRRPDAETMALEYLRQRGELLFHGGYPVLSTDLPVRDLICQAIDEGRVLFFPAGRWDFRSKREPPSTVDLVAPVAQHHGYASRECEPGQIRVNAGYFTWIEEEFCQPFCRALDPVGLTIINGKIRSLPVANRTAVLFRKGSSADFQVLSPRNVRIRLPGATNWLQVTDRPQANGTRMYWRETNHDFRVTPKTSDPNDVDVVICRDTVAAIRRFGGATVPNNGLVIRLTDASPNTLSRTALIDALEQGVRQIEAQLVDNEGIPIVADSGFQCGPVLYGDSLQNERSEDFDAATPEGWAHSVPPVALNLGVQRHQLRARAALGLDRSGCLVGAFVEGTEPRTMVPGVDAPGLTEADFMGYLKDLGLVLATNLDGGGAATLVASQRSLLSPADRNGVYRAAQERLIPGTLSVDL